MKTITLTDEAYQRLKAWKVDASDSLSGVVLRAVPKRGTGHRIRRVPGVGKCLANQHGGRGRWSWGEIGGRRMIERLLDTNFLISRWRDGPASPAATWLLANRDLRAGLPWIVKAEFLRGATVAGHGTEPVGNFLGRYPTAWPDDKTLTLYAELYARLREQNAPPGPNELWIAATALQLGVPLVTRNTAQFAKVGGLVLEDYQSASKQECEHSCRETPSAPRGHLMK